MREYFTDFILAYLKFFAKIALTLHKPYIVGIAGSAGKSSTKHAVYAILKDHFQTKMIEGNSETGIPLGVLGLPTHNYSIKDWLLVLLKAPFGLFTIAGARYLIVEMGIDDPFPPKNMEYLLTILKPNITINLNVSGTHTEQFEKLLPKEKMTDEEQLNFLLQKIAEEDTKIATQSGCEVCIYNKDDRFIDAILENNTQIATIKTFGKDTINSLSYDAYDLNLEGTYFSFLINNAEKISLHLSAMLLPEVYREVFAASILVALQLGLSIEQIQKSLEKNFTLPKSRSSILKGIKNTTIIDSSYNSSKNSVISFLEMIQVLKQKTNKPVIFLCGDMNELGNEAKVEHEQIAQKIVESVDYLYCVGKLTKQYVIPYAESHKKMTPDLRWFTNARDLGIFLQTAPIDNAIILVKGSQNGVYLEEAIQYILADKHDSKKLCRQDNFWRQKKQMYFNNTS